MLRRRLQIPECGPLPQFKFCGGGGYAIPRQAVLDMVRNDIKAFFAEYMWLCRKLDNWCDQVTACMLLRRGYKLRQLAGLNGWEMQGKALHDALQKKPLTFHYVRDDQMYYIHKWIKKNTAT